MNIPVQRYFHILIVGREYEFVARLIEERLDFRTIIVAPDDAAKSKPSLAPGFRIRGAFYADLGFTAARYPTASHICIRQEIIEPFAHSPEPLR